MDKDLGKEISRRPLREDDRRLVRFDWAIKRLLRNKADHSVLEGFLTSLLGEQIKIIRYLESEGNRSQADEKSNRVDIVAEDHKGEKILIEVQNETENEYFHRMLFGTSRMIIDHVKVGQPFGTVPKVYSINIVYFELGDKSDYIYHGKTEFLGLHTGRPLELVDRIKRKFDVDKTSDIFPEYYILLANDFDRWSKTPLDQWMYFLSTSSIPEEADAPGLQEAREQLSIDKLSKEDRVAYFKHLDNMRSLTSMVETAWENGEWEGEKKGFAKGVQHGIEQGIEQGKWETANNLHRLGVDIKTISQATGLDENDLKENLPSASDN